MENFYKYQKRNMVNQRRIVSFPRPAMLGAFSTMPEKDGNGPLGKVAA